jgi:ABC-2 type transport system permease protein
MSAIQYKYKIGVRRFGYVNWVGFYTLYLKEVQRFFKVWVQTIVSPIVTLLLFLTVFSLAIGSERTDVLGHKFTVFLVPGLIAMQIMQNAFANTSSSLMISKVQGNIVDILFPPLSAGEVTFSLILGGITRGLVVGFFSILVSLFFIKIPFAHIFYVIVFGILGSCLLAALGFIAGLWAEKFDNMAAVTNFIVVPLSFLSGTFFSINKLEGPIHTISQFNPFFYIIDGFRYGFLGQSDSNVYFGMLILFVCNMILIGLCYLLFKKGYKIKA